MAEESEREKVIDELIELLELQIKLKEGGISFRLAHLLGLPGTRLEHIQKRLKNRTLIRKSLEKHDTKTLKESVELSRMRLKGVEREFVEKQKEYDNKISALEGLMKDVEKEVKKTK